MLELAEMQVDIGSNEGSMAINRVISECPLAHCDLDMVHGHEGYGLRFSPRGGTVTSQYDEALDHAKAELSEFLTEQLIRTVARGIIARVVADAIASEAWQVDWNEYPNLGEHDWNRVIEHVQHLATMPADFEAVVERLSRREG